MLKSSDVLLPADDDVQADSNGFYTISAVEALTGVNKITIRAWETRHGLIQPARTSSGRRLYSEEDISRINMAVQLKKQGVAISRVPRVIEGSHIGQHHAGDSGTWSFYREQMVQAVVDFDDAALDAIYAKVLTIFSLELVTQELMMPVLQMLGERWQERAGGIAEEHFFSLFMRNKLGSSLNLNNGFHHNQPTKAVYVAACLPDEMHELGLLVFSLAAKARACRVVMLGANVPVAEIVETSRRVGCDGVVIACSARAFTHASQDHLTNLCQQVSVPVWVGGQGALIYQEAIASTGARIIGEDVERAMHTMLEAGDGDVE